MLPLSSDTGLDYVSHTDVLPYIATDQDPFRHDLFDQFLTPKDQESGEGEYTISYLHV